MLLTMQATPCFDIIRTPQSASIDTTTIEYLERFGLAESETRQELMAELADIYRDCLAPGWDGYGAKSVEHSAVCEADLFISLIPSFAPLPYISATPSGGIALEWRKDRDNILMLTLTGKQQLAYAAVLNGRRRMHGTELFIDEIPEIVAKLISNFK